MRQIVGFCRHSQHHIHSSASHIHCHMSQIMRTIIAFLFLASTALTSSAQMSLSRSLMKDFCTHDSIDFSSLTSPRETGPLIDRDDFDQIISTPDRLYGSATSEFAGPAVYDKYQLLDTVSLALPDHGLFANAYTWLDDYDFSHRILANSRQNYIFNNPDKVTYNAATLPEPPKAYRTYVDPITTNIVIEEIDIKPESNPIDISADITYKKWLHRFDASLQFSQAYISPNWYQGGNNNLNMIGQLLYHVKLNPQFFPNVLFETTASYKLALNSAPDDSIHSINISEDIFQINSTFGLKAAKRWYYSANLMFKTQLFKSYPTNSRSLSAAFMSPGELNLGLGMTYNYESPKKNLTFGASISPLSWNLKTCTNKMLDPTAYGIEAGHTSINKFGSSAELNLKWKIAYNISYTSRLFAFTDYDKFQGDWEHTVDFNINKFLSTRFYLHMRYDTDTQRPADSKKWHKFQLKEIFSFGFAYSFGV